MRRRKTYPDATLTEAQIEAAERLCGQLRDWQRPLAALEKLQAELPSFDVLTTLLKTTAVNGLMATNVYALVAVAAHVQEVVANASLDKAGVELVEKIADFKHKNKTRANVSFASKFAHFFIDPDRFPMKDTFSTKMIEFHLGTANCVQTKEKKQDESYTAFVRNIEQLKLRDGLDEVSNRRLDRYLWFAGKYRFFMEKPPFEKGNRVTQQDGSETATKWASLKKEFLGSLKVCRADDLAAVLGSEAGGVRRFGVGFQSRIRAATELVESHPLHDSIVAGANPGDNGTEVIRGCTCDSTSRSIRVIIGAWQLKT